MNTLCQRLRGGTFPTDDGKDDRGGRRENTLTKKGAKAMIRMKICRVGLYALSAPGTGSCSGDEKRRRYSRGLRCVDRISLQQKINGIL